MRLSLITVVTLALLGCSSQPLLPTAPSPAPPAQLPRLLTLSLMVMDDWCIIGATVEIVQGPGTGRSVTQTECGDWWYVPYGVFLPGLFEGQWVTIRVSAAGYASKDISMFPSGATWETTAPPGAIWGYHAGNMIITLTRL